MGNLNNKKEDENIPISINSYIIEQPKNKSKISEEQKKRNIEIIKKLSLVFG